MPHYNRMSKNHRSLVKKSIDAKQNKAIKKLKTEVKKLAVTIEKKYWDKQISLSVSSAPYIYPLNDLALFTGNQQDRHKQREGQSIVLTSFRLRGLVEIVQNAVSPDLNNRIRLMIVFTKDSTTPVAITDILASNTIDSFKLIKPPHDYDVMYDRVFNLQNVEQNHYVGGNYAAPTEKYRLPFDIRLGTKKFTKSGIKCTWELGDATGTAPRQGALTLIALSDSGVISHPSMRAASRLRFMDA